MVKKKVLVVEDNAVNRGLLKNILSPVYAVLEAENGAQALQVLAEQGEDIVVILLDMVMPVMDGYAFLDRKNQIARYASIPVIVTTSSDSEEDEISALAHGASDFIAKPYKAQVLLHRMASIIRLRESAAVIDMLTYDPLTGLYAKQAFLRKVSELASSHPAGAYVIARWDIDRFQVYNDSLGNAAGDRLLKDIGQYIRHLGEEWNDWIFAHLEADHFACCMPMAQFDGGKAVAFIEEMLTTLSPDFHCIPRVGAYQVDEPGLEPSLACDRALLALRSTKGNMAKRFAWYDDSMRQALSREQQLLSEILEALKNDQFDLYFQPKYDQYTHTVAGAEALARWFHPEKGILLPSVFVETMEHNRLITRLSERVWEKAVAWLAERKRRGKRVVPISVNASWHDLCNPAFEDKLCALIEKYGIEPDLLHLEITETVYMKDPQNMADTFNRLRERGFGIEIDDFGSGYSSLNTLKNVPIDKLKLDMNFLSDTAGESAHNSGIIISSIIRMAHWMGLRVIAEGVETIQQADYLKSIGCRYVQGYLFGRPMAVERFEALLDGDQPPLEIAARETFVDSYFSGADFWKPESQAAVVFNTLVGAAGILEYQDGRLSCIRANERFFQDICRHRDILSEAGLNLLDTVVEEDRQRVSALFQEASQNSQEYETELKWYGGPAAGDLQWMHLRFRRIAYNQERTIFYAAAESITNRKRMQEHQQQLLAAVQSAYPLAMTVNLTQDTYTPLCSHDYPLLRLPPEGGCYSELVGACLSNLQPQDRPIFEAAFLRDSMLEKSRAGERGYHTEFRQLCDDGAWHWIESLVQFLTVPWESDQFCLILCRPIDGQKALEERLRAMLTQASSELEKERFNLHLIADHVVAQMLIYRVADRRILYMGGRLFKSYGYTEEEIQDFAVSRLSTLLYMEDLRPTVRRVIQQSGKMAPHFEMEFRIARKDGALAWVLSKGNLARDNEGSAVYVFVMMDISERKAMEERLRESDDFIQLAASLYDRALYRYDPVRGYITALNPQACREAGFLPQYEDMPHGAMEKGIVLPESVGELRRLHQSIQDGAPSGFARLRLRPMPGAQPIWTEARFRSRLDGEGKVLSTALSLADIEDVYEKEMAYARQLVKIQEEVSSRVGSIQVDLTFGVVERQSALPDDTADMTGWPYEQALDYMIETFLPGDVGQEVRKKYNRDTLLKSVEAGTSSLSGEHYVNYPDGSVHWIHVGVQLVRDPYTGNVKAFGIISDVTEEKRRALDVLHRAEIDELTGLYNRATAQEKIDQLLSAGRRCALLMLDMDNLKTINDTYGHRVGDNALKAIGEVLRAHFRENDVVGRIGGDEFVVLLADVSRNTSLRRTLFALKRKIAAIRIGENRDIPVQCSIGGAFSGLDACRFDELYRRADRALYHVKRNEKGYFAFYAPDMEKDELNGYRSKLFLPLNRPAWFDNEEIRPILEAVTQFFPMIIQANLTRNSFYMVEYDCFTTKKAPEYGEFDELIQIGASTFHPEDRAGFLAAFARDNLLRAFGRGQRVVNHQGRQLGDDGVYRVVHTSVVFFENEEGDICQVTLARPLE